MRVDGRKVKGCVLLVILNDPWQVQVEFERSSSCSDPLIRGFRNWDAGLEGDRVGDRNVTVVTKSKNVSWVSVFHIQNLENLGLHRGRGIWRICTLTGQTIT
jgi:hypothetical protein